jgi:integrase
MTTLRDPGYQSPVLIAKGGTKFATRRGLSSASINRVYEALHAALERAVRDRLITWNPATHVKPPREHNRSYGSWSPAQTAAFLDLTEVREHRAYAAWHVVLVTGVRRGELAGAMWHEVDLDDAVWELRENLVQVAGKTTRKGTKSQAGTRLVYLDSETVGVLRAHRRLQREDRLRLGRRWVDYPHSNPETGLPCSCDGPVFRSPRGGECKPDWFTDNWAALVDIAVMRIPGLPRIPLHGSRHTAVSAATSMSAPLPSRRSNGSATRQWRRSGATATSTRSCTARSPRPTPGSSPSIERHNHTRRASSSPLQISPDTACHDLAWWAVSFGRA